MVKKLFMDDDGGLMGFLGRNFGRLMGGLVVLVVLYYAIGALWVSRIDDDPNFTAPDTKGSRAVATAAALVAREVDRNGWVANDPFFLPGALLDDMPNFQMGIVAATARFAVEMTDQIGRTRGSSQVDADLEKAAGLLKYSGTVWIWDLGTSWLPTTSSEQQYRAAIRALQAYDLRLGEGQATFERRADNLLATLERIAADIGSSSAALEARIAEHSSDLVDLQADDLFYAVKGRLYAYSLILRALGVDYATVIKDKDLGGAWDQMIDSFREAASLAPLVVINGAPDSAWQPSHLSAQGFYLLRARTRLREVTNILLK